MSSLNKGQREAVGKLIKFQDSNQDIFTLNGPAGVGKTYCITQFVRAAMAKSKMTGMPMPRVYLSAPTHKAVSVIADLLEEDALRVDCGTLHSLLGLYLNADNELKNLADGGTHRLGDYSLIIVDEGSMVGTKLFDKYQQKMGELRMQRRPTPKGIFLGDSLQLDPPKDTQSPVFNHIGHTLTEQMRQLGDNPIGDLIARSRSHVESGLPLPRTEPKLNGDGDGIHIVKRDEFEDMVLSNFDTDEYKDDSHYCKVLAWRNVEVEKWNGIIRDHLLGKDADQIVVGETLVIQSPVLDIDDRVLMHTDQEVTVTGLTTDYVEEQHFDHGHRKFKVWVVSGQTKDGIFGNFDVLHEDSREDYEKYVKILKAAAYKHRSEWKNYWGFCDQFIPVRPPYACTIHKSQGSSFTNVFVSMTDVNRCKNGKDRNRLIYVGLSRARQNIVLNTGRMA